MNPEIKRLVKAELSGERAKANVEQITRFHRIQASPMFHQAAEHVRQQLVEIGLPEAKVEQFPSDGAIKYWTHTTPVGWEVKGAELRLIEPEDRLLARYSETPASLHTLSNATPPGGVKAELIDVGKGIRPEDYEGKSVNGKLVLATGRARFVHEQAVYKRGAAGVLTDAPYEIRNVRESVDIPDAHSYQSIWPTADELPKVKFGFSISKRQGDQLRALLKDGKTVRLQGKVDAKLFPSSLDVVTATVRGSSKPDEEVFLVAHLCHPQPSANDNASGSGLLIEIARTIQALVSSNKMARPRRTIRFLWVPETYGTVAWLYHHQNWISRLIAGINLDMVGENQELCKSTLNIDLTPDSLPSYLNDLLRALVEDSVNEFDAVTPFGSSSTFRHTEIAHTGGSDHHEFVDSTVRVPCVMLLQWPDTFYHSSMDTIDKVSADSLKRVGWIATVAAIALANADAEDAVLLAHLTASRGIARIEQAEREALQALYDRKGDSKASAKKTDLARDLTKIHVKSRDKIEHIRWRERQAVASVERLANDAETKRKVRKLQQDIDLEKTRALARIEDGFSYLGKALGISLPARVEVSEAEKEAESMIPKRLFTGTLSVDAFRKFVGVEQYRWYEEILEKDRQFTVKRPEIINFMDGKRTLLDIVNAVSAEYGETSTEYVLKFVKDLENAKLIAIQLKKM